MCVEVKKLGFSAIAPATDLLVGIMASNYKYSDYANNSLEILKRCDIVYMGEGWSKSSGCICEANTARKEKIPVAFSIEEVLKLSEPLLKKIIKKDKKGDLNDCCCSC